MKPIVRQVDGEWRVWVPAGFVDRQGETVHLGDTLEWEVSGRAYKKAVGPDAYSGCVFDMRHVTPSHRGRVVDSPGIPCDVEGAVEVSQVLEIVDSEEELEGPAPADFARLAGSLELAARAAVRATKKSIRRRIDNLAREAASSSFRGVAILGTDRPFEKEAE